MTTGELSWSEVEGAELDVATLYDVLALRSAVFVVEQECAYQDIDGLDLAAGTVHVIGGPTRSRRTPGCSPPTTGTRLPGSAG